MGLSSIRQVKGKGGEEEREREELEGEMKQEGAVVEEACRKWVGAPSLPRPEINTVSPVLPGTCTTNLVLCQEWQ